MISTMDSYFSTFQHPSRLSGQRDPLFFGGINTSWPWRAVWMSPWAPPSSAHGSPARPASGLTAELRGGTEGRRPPGARPLVLRLTRLCFASFAGLRGTRCVHIVRRLLFWMSLWPQSPAGSCGDALTLHAAALALQAWAR